jgi:hypothetical protein
VFLGNIAEKGRDGKMLAQREELRRCQHFSERVDKIGAP